MSNAAIEALTSHRAALTEGLNSIPEQVKHIDRMREGLEALIMRLAESEQALLDIDVALSMLGRAAR